MELSNTKLDGSVSKVNLLHQNKIQPLLLESKNISKNLNDVSTRAGVSNPWPAERF